MKIYLIYGGKSAEHDISILTAHSIIKAIYFNYYEVVPVYITKAGAWIQGQSLSEPVAFSENLYLEPGSEKRFADSQDGKSYGELISPADIQSEDAVIFPVLHGPNGEDGTVQGLFEVLNMPYVGCGVLASASGMDKIVSKHLFQQAGLPQVPYVAVTRNDWKNDREKIFIQCEGSLIYPMYVKPANMGSSVGISKATNLEELTAAIETAFRYDRRVVVEQGIEAREIEIAVLGNDDVHTSVPGEIVKTKDFYDYEEKYGNEEVLLQIPAELPEEITAKLQNYATIAFRALDGSGLSRCDFFVTKNNEIYINEVNTLPGFTSRSMYPLLWEETGLKYSDLVEELIQLALKRHEEKVSYQFVE
ncbi:D-alanine--D-alanine ligase [Trichococcus pasteurii]|uniref:D-alanine--D-alanine ligase n=1 Tax=Trichococcus pasteurii TaxID=43064 RepID=A0A1W1IJ05_9LACT|nr:D-alanine--D-alanine ligase [Trichococcus pasteurii]SFE93083.1 D-alanine-D-alanine ligase [Trichococcus pasteurii]SLM53054.1 d-alanine--d-alanine ligase signature 1 [Trichococcus pasteurii]SSB93935.1 d-alanine--d-alanine ligase signature 1 [Trichococcus pasteurii]